jgi:hypothetical protein
MCLVGFSINISDVAPGVKYFGTFLCVGGSYAGFPGVVAWQVSKLVYGFDDTDISSFLGLGIICQVNINER